MRIAWTPQEYEIVFKRAIELTDSRSCTTRRSLEQAQKEVLPPDRQRPTPLHPALVTRVRKYALEKEVPAGQAGKDKQKEETIEAVFELLISRIVDLVVERTAERVLKVIEKLAPPADVETLLTTPPLEADKKPKLLLIGMDGRHHEEIHNAVKDRLHIRCLTGKENQGYIGVVARNYDAAIVNIKFCSHNGMSAVKNSTLKKVSYVSGGVSAVKAEIDKIFPHTGVGSNDN